MHYGLELGAVLSALRPAMAAKGVALAGYWADCPREYSRDYPNATRPLPAGSGYRKLAAALRLVHGMGLLMGKTFNSQQGGQTSAEAFYDGTLADWAGAAAVVPSAASGGKGFDGVMVETWYFYPKQAIPETTPFTTAYTALAVFDNVTSTAAPSPANSSWKLEVDLSARATFFNYSRDSCFAGDVVDETLAAFRLRDGSIRMIGGNGDVGPCSFVGPSLLNMTRDCATGPVIRSRVNMTAPGDFPHKMWLPATWVEDDGVTVHGLVHDEYHAGSAWGQPASMCPSNNPDKCWYSAAIAVKSTDGGKSFRRVTSAANPNAVAIAAPIPYKPDAGTQGAPGHRGIVSGRNGDGFYYVMPDCAYLAQLGRHPGKCVFRTRTIADPTSWRGWNGTAWAARWFDPYRAPRPNSLEPYTAAAVNTQLNGGLTYVPSVGAFVLLGTRGSRHNPEALGVLEYSWSSDLLEWAPPKILIAFNHTPGVRDGRTGLYPTMLDPSDASRNFDRFGTSGHLYFTEFDCPPKGRCLNRNVVRYPLHVVVSSGEIDQ